MTDLRYATDEERAAKASEVARELLSSSAERTNTATPIGSLLVDPDEPVKMVPCLRCRKLTPIAESLYAAIGSWNRNEARLADKHGRYADLIRSGELVTCDDCTVPEREDRAAESIRQNEETRGLLALLLAGKYNPESLQTLRRRGLGAYVDRAMESAGTDKANE